MDQNQLRDGLGRGHLRMDQDLNARLGVIEFRLHREALLVQLAAPVIARNGEQVRVPKEWDKRPQETIVEADQKAVSYVPAR